MKKYLFLPVCALAFLLPVVASAHQPRITTDAVTIVTDPETSKAYYAQLSGEPQVYRISATKPFALYVNVLVPDIAGQKKDVSAVIIKDGDAEHPLAVLDGTTFAWTRFWEEFGRNWYWEGPEYKATAEAGEYEVRVWSSNNDSKYSLAIGEAELFDAKESVNALHLIPQIKKDFFNESPISFLLSPFGFGYVFVMFVLAGVFGFLYRFLLKKFARTSPTRRLSKNISTSDRLLRAGFGLGLFLLAIATSWSPFLLFAAGFCFFEAAFSWCGLYAAMGKSTCPMP